MGMMNIQDKILQELNMKKGQNIAIDECVECFTTRFIFNIMRDSLIHCYQELDKDDFVDSLDGCMSALAEFCEQNSTRKSCDDVTQKRIDMILEKNAYAYTVELLGLTDKAGMLS